MSSSTFTLISTSPAATHELGTRLGSVLQPGLVIALHGELGAGKTLLTQGVAAGLGVSERVTSPTFTLVNRYATAHGFDLVHIDCYRLGESADEALAEAATIGLDEILADENAAIVIEWAERVAAFLPTDHLDVTIVQPDGDTQCRQLSLQATGPASAAVLASLSIASPA